ncbi:hypothetical protein [Paulownia witches'-broom phytoplasma]|uniref:hypothetical protein n=1 Tax=Paulownia witches'-broom phytoplasma TaxID=39647 RepID=UPI0030DCBA47
MMEAKTPQEKAQYIKDLIEEFTGATGSKTYFMKERKKIIELLRNSLVSNLSAPNIKANFFSPEQNQRLEEFKTTNPTYLHLTQQEKNILYDLEKKLQEFENALNNITLSEPNKTPKTRDNLAALKKKTTTELPPLTGTNKKDKIKEIRTKLNELKESIKEEIKLILGLELMQQTLQEYLEYKKNKLKIKLITLLKNLLLVLMHLILLLIFLIKK